ncbi:MAG: chemotaxis protein CheB, partial [Campylobacteraceae bacterium]|nr:chemotaxis protein CheB [Campylobacteraceae bacterium]
QLNNNCNLEVKYPRDKQVIQNRKIYILLENYEIKEQNNEIIFCKSEEVINYSPNINLLFNSVAKISKNIKIMSIVLTGIGDDGALGALNLAKQGAICINESEESSIVYGMPKAAHELNPKAPQMNIDDISKEIGKF